MLSGQNKDTVVQVWLVLEQGQALLCRNEDEDEDAVNGIIVQIINMGQTTVMETDGRGV